MVETGGYEGITFLYAETSLIKWGKWSSLRAESGGLGSLAICIFIPPRIRHLTSYIFEMLIVS
jgi:hypothetical protein